MQNPKISGNLNMQKGKIKMHGIKYEMQIPLGDVPPS